MSSNLLYILLLCEEGAEEIHQDVTAFHLWEETGYAGIVILGGDLIEVYNIRQGR